MNEKNKLLKNVASVGIIQIANYIFPMISVPIISRIIGPEKFGIINFMTAFVAYFTLLIGYGFDLTATRRISADPDNIPNRNKIFSEVFTTKLLLFGVSTILFLISLFVVPSVVAERNVAIFTFITCIATVITQNWFFQAMQDLYKVAILNLISKVVFTVAVLLIIHKKADYIWQPLVLSLSLIIAGVVSFVWSIKKYKIKFLRVSMADCFTLLWSEKIFFFSLCIISLYTNTNIVVLGFMDGAESVGFYTAGQKFIVIAQMIITVPLAQALYPFIGRAFGESFEKGMETVRKLIPVVIVLTLFSCISIIVGAPFFIKMFYGDNFQPAVLVCRILAFIPMFIAVGTVLGIHVMLNLKMDKVFFKVTCIGCVFGVFLNLILVYFFGFVGSATTWVLTEALNLSMLIYFLKQKDIKWLNKDYFKPRYVIDFIVKFRK